MAYRLEDRFTEPELVEWVERQASYDEWIWHWFGGLGVGLICGFVLAWAVTL